MADPYSTADDAARVIAADQASAAKILRTANSSIYGFRTKIDDMTKAIFYIGFDEVKNLVLAMTIIDLFKKSDLNQEFNPVELWKHSIAVGVLTRILGGIVGEKNIENYFVAGILHDIGKLFFVRYYEEEYAKVISHARREETSLRRAEHDILGVTHNIVGEMIAEKWKLPGSIKDAIRYHHGGVAAGRFDPLVGCVHIANTAVKMMGLGSGGDPKVEAPNSKVWEELDLPPNLFTGIIKKILNDYRESLAIFLL